MHAITKCALALLARMRYESEAYWAAGWMMGIEFQLWHQAHNGDHPELKVLAELSEGWWMWDEEEEGENPVFVPLDRWTAIVADALPPSWLA